eukprot:15456069-Alexandrium_andersonii.AAC.1
MESAYTRALVRTIGPDSNPRRGDPFDPDQFYLHMLTLLYERANDVCKHPGLSRVTASLTCSLLPFLCSLKSAS